MLLNLGGIFLVALLGLLPLAIVHLSYHDTKLRPPRMPRTAFQTVLALKATVLVGLTDWIMTVAV